MDERPPLSDLTLVVPCHDEALRLDGAAFLAWLDAHAGARLLFVDDGSTDATPQRLAALCQHPRAAALRLPTNLGKGEAVRHGLKAAMEDGAAVVGFWDADLATPLDAVAMLHAHLQAHPDLLIVMGARIKLLGRDVARTPARHYVGRIAATLASLVLGLPVYDTQCGAKLLRNTPVTQRLVAAAFFTRWLFDVELLLRLRAVLPDHDARAIEGLVHEVPLPVWRAVPGSQVRPRDVLLAPWLLLWIRLRRPPV